MALSFFDTTAEALYKSYVDKLQSLTGEKMYEGDERLVFAQCFFTVIVALFNSFNEAAKARMLRYAYGEILDAIGEFRNCKRLQPSKASCVVSFSIPSIRNTSVSIPKGTRVTADGSIVFETVEGATISVGEKTVEVEAVCQKGGSFANGVPVGALSTMMDNVAHVSGCSNTTISSGGNDGEPYPYDANKYPDGDDGTGDNRYRERIRLANSAFSTAGSEDSYIYWAKSASAEIVDVRVISDKAAGTVELVVMTESGVPSEDVKEKVLEVCSAKDVRPMNDIVSVSAPEEISYDIEIDYTVMDGDQNKAIDSITGEGGAVERFTKHIFSRLGRDINPDLLKLYCLQSGVVYSCDIVAPVYRDLTPRQLGKWSGKITLNEPTVKFEE